MRSLACSSAPSIWAPDPPNLSPRPPLVTTRTVRKAIFPAAGLGTRFLPVTKAQPKEMLPLVDKPTIQYGVEEAIASGIEQVIMVTGGGKRAIVDHFDRSLELEHYLEERGKSDMLHILSEVDDLSNQLEITYMVEKPEPGTEPSDLAILGRYVLTPAVFAALDQAEPGAGKEIQLTDAIKHVLGKEPVVALEFTGDYYDTGTVPGYLRANLMLAMKREGLREQLLPLIQELRDS